jgi:hypothetical protein
VAANFGLSGKRVQRMSSKEEIVKALQLFNNKVQKLEHSRFIQGLSQSNSGFTLSHLKNESGSWLKAERQGPDDEAIDAATLTFRFFNQDKDRISLRRISKYYAEAPIDVSFSHEYEKIRREMNEYLDGEKYSVANYNGVPLVRRELIETFMYGELAHVNEAKETLFQEWKRAPMTFTFFESQFVDTMGNLFVGLQMIAELNERALTELQAAAPLPYHPTAR